MVKMNECIGRELQWVQPAAMKQYFELRSGDVSLGSLHLQSSFNSKATAVNDDGSWDFNRPGFWQRQATVRAAGGLEDLALFQANTWKPGGTLTLANGRKYLASANFWMTQFFLTTEGGQKLISYTSIRGMFHYTCSVEIHGLARNLVELSWMVPFGWYLTMMMMRDSSAAAAAA